MRIGFHCVARMMPPLLVCVACAMCHETFSAEWKAHVGDYDFKNDTYALRVTPAGDILNLEFNEVRVLGRACVWGMTQDEQGRQVKLKAVEKNPVIEIKREDNLTSIKASGRIRGENGADLENCAVFEVEAICHPERIEFQYKLTTLKMMTFAQRVPFCVVAYAPVDSFAGKPLEVINAQGSLAVLEVKQKFEKIQYQTNNLQSFSFVLDNGKIEFASGDDHGREARMSICDGREWKGNNLEISIMPLLPVSRMPDGIVNYPVGQVFKWSYRIHFTQF